jgi:sacsin
MKNLTGIHYKDGAEIIDTKYATIQKELFDVKARVVDELNKKIMEKSADLENISRKLNALRKLIITGMSELVKPEDAQKKICPVCFDSEVNMVLVPCGHTYCRGCAEMDRSRNARCHQCRAVINSRIKLYFTA